jgi:hypothetical protein
VLALDEPLLAARAGAVMVVLLAAAILATPGLGALAGVLATSGGVRAGMSKAAGIDASAPPVFWLSLVPALGALAMGACAWPAARWAVGGDGETAAIIGAAAAIVLGLLLWFAGRAMVHGLSTATREIAALDAVKLASLQLDRARGLERLVGRALAGAGRLVFEKDVALARRRFPMFYLLGGLALIVCSIVGAAAEADTRATWATWLTTAMAAYLVVMGRRLARPPVERPRLLAVLPLGRGLIARGKLAFLTWRAVWVALVPVVAVARAPELGLRVAIVVVPAWLVAWILAQRR